MTKDVQAVSGIVVAGFGEDELFAHLVEISLDGAVAGIIRTKGLKQCGMDREKTKAEIVPFAQRDMMVRYVEGIGPGTIQIFWKMPSTTCYSEMQRQS